VAKDKKTSDAWALALGESEQPKEDATEASVEAQDEDFDSVPREDKVEDKPKFWDEVKNKRRGREFELRDVLQVITGNMLSRSWEEQLSLVGYMIGERRPNTRDFKNVHYQIALPYCKEELLVQFPELAEYQEVRFDMESSVEASAAWLAELERKYGATVKVEILPDKFADEVDKAREADIKAKNPPRRKVTQKSDSLEAIRV
jgi:hypothetical protein